MEPAELQHECALGACDEDEPYAAECDGIDEPAELQEGRCIMGACGDRCFCTKEYKPMCCWCGL